MARILGSALRPSQSVSHQIEWVYKSPRGTNFIAGPSRTRKNGLLDLALRTFRLSIATAMRALVLFCLLVCASSSTAPPPDSVSFLAPCLTRTYQFVAALRSSDSSLVPPTTSSPPFHMRVPEHARRTGIDQVFRESLAAAEVCWQSKRGSSGNCSCGN